MPSGGASWSLGEWVGATFVVILAGWLAKELALVLLTVGGVLLAISWVSNIELDTPVAIVLGAIVISYTIYVTNQRR